MIKINKLASIVYRYRLNHNDKGIIARILKKMGELVWKDDIVIQTVVNNQKMLMNYGHRLPFFQKNYKNYDCQLRKICGMILDGGGGILDVGANIGDTVINIGDHQCKYLLIEGEKSYAKFIDENLKGYLYELEVCYLTDEESLGYAPVNENGTGHLELVEGKEKTSNLVTLDHLIFSKYSDFFLDLLKIDTDGFDFKVLRGAVDTLKKFAPYIYFEWGIKDLKSNNEDLVSIFQYLASLGYDEIIVFDNYGNLLFPMGIYNNNLLEYLAIYPLHSNVINYYDVLVIHKRAEVRSEQFIREAILPEYYGN